MNRNSRSHRPIMYFRVYICLIFFFVTVIAGAVGDYYCFRDRVPAGRFGRCQNLIANKNTIRACCRAGGAGWTDKSNGKRCGSACSPVTEPPVNQPVPSEDEQEPTQPAVDEDVKYCFRTRVPNGRLGGCSDLIGERTQGDCCRQGGKGWTDRGSGRRCEDACLGVIDGGPVQHCFSRISSRGRCVESTGEKTRLQCCQDGGIGWSANANGRPCEDACEEEPTEVPAAIHGGWSDWGDWGQCSVTCREGIQRRSRTCDNPAPARGGDDCVGSESESAVCDEGPCPINGGWGRWGRAGECSATCYHEGHSVYRQMRRECDNPPPQFGGLPCRGPALKNQKCTELPHCPVDGGWSEYGDWSACSQTCEEGIQTRQRTCTNPPPQYNGRQCEGIDTEQQVCRNRRVCPVHGGWSDWGQWSACDSPRCGVDGTKFRSRSCTNPKPRNRGNYCIGPIIDRMDCSKCEIAGGWSDWSEWGPCTGNCGRHDFRKRYRICNNPLPQNGGSCEGSYQDIGECRGLDPCPNNPGDQGSGSGEGSGVNVPDFPCDDEDSCNEGAVNGAQDEDGSFSYSLDISIDVHTDVPPVDPCDQYDVYSISHYNNRVGCPDEEEDIDVIDNPSVVVNPPVVVNDNAYSYSYDDPIVDPNEHQPSVPQEPVEENNVGNSDSYSFDEVEGNAPNVVVEENNEGDSYSYSFDEEEGNAPNVVVEEINDGDSNSYSVDYEEDNVVQPEGDEEEYSYSV